MRINGIGCSLVDNLYSPVNFNSKAYARWSSKDFGRDCIITGGLVFGEDLEKISGESYKTILRELIGEELHPVRNIGGPAIVALINISQILNDKEYCIGFFGARGDDENGRYIKEKVESLRINIDGYDIVKGITPFTDVLSDPHFNDGNGERSFINYIGAAGNIQGQDISDSFFDADYLVYGGTALTPCLHDDLSYLLKKGKEARCLNFINTVYDYRNQKLNPDKNWPLVAPSEDFKLIDLIVTDNVESLRISGQQTKEDAALFFLDRGIKSGIITHGSENIICFSDGNLFSEKGIFSMPVSEFAGNRIRQSIADSMADTTGCGDNFAGGVYASTVLQIKESNADSPPSLRKAAILGIACGGFAGLYHGGVYYEKKQGEKLEKLNIIIKEYKKQLGTLSE